jgi:hypothetical protein
VSKTSNFYTIAILLFSLYFFINIMPVSANEDDWNSFTVTLGYENPIASIDGYTLEALKFDGYGMVWIQVSKDNATLDDAVLETNSSGWCYMDSEKVRLKALNVTDKRVLPMFSNLCSPEAEVVFEIKKLNENNVNLNIDLDADKEKYLLGDEVTVAMDLRNTGEVQANKIKLNVDPDGLLLQNEVPENIQLDKASKKPYDLKFKFPENVKESYNITVEASWEDSSGNHSMSETEEIKVIEPLEIYKNTGSEVFKGGPAYVTVSVKNVQDRTVTVSLFDTLPATFTLLKSDSDTNISDSNTNISDSDNSSYLSWNFVLASEETKTIYYSIRSEQLGAHRVPQAHAYANLCGQQYTKSSDSDNIITVYGNILYKDYNNKTTAEVIPPAEVILKVNVSPT